jgi:hypothetical protein
VSGQKHVVAGFLFAYLLAGVGLEHIWTTRSRATTAVVLATLTLWGGFQCYWQDRSWPDVRPLADYLVRHLRPGERILAESSWNYILPLYVRGLIAAPTDVVDAQYSAASERGDGCRITWLAGDPDGAAAIRAAADRCRHRPVLASTTWQYYVDSARMRIGRVPAAVRLYWLEPRLSGVDDRAAAESEGADGGIAFP